MDKLAVRTNNRVSEHSWFDGAICVREAGAPSVASINFHLGTSVFDGLMAYWNDDHYYIHRGEQHLIRFQDGAARMGMNIPWTVDEMLSGIDELLRLQPIGTQYVRPIAYRRGPELWVTGAEGRPVNVCIFTVGTERDSDSGLTCHISPIERISSRAVPKHTKVSGAYVNSFYARRTAELAGFQDGLMFDREDRVAEASAANFFGVISDTLWTPPLNTDVFPGITRYVVIELAKRLGIECKQANLGRKEVAALDGAFLCSTLMEIRALTRIDAREIPTHELPIYQAILGAFRDLTHQ